MDSIDFRRAFPLDSRSVWIEQQLVQEVCVPRDNYPIGPGEYSPIKIDKHVSTPSLRGSSMGVRDHFNPFTARTQTKQKERTRKIQDTNISVKEDLEYKTIFHDHDKRVPLDPKLRTCATPGPHFYESSILESTMIDGKHHARNVIFGQADLPFGERMPTKVALPDYEVKDDLLKHKPPLGCEVNERRFMFTSQRKREPFTSYDPTYMGTKLWQTCPTAIQYEKNQLSQIDLERQCLHTEFRKINRQLDTSGIDTSPYKQNFRRSKPNNCQYKKLNSLDPKSIDKEVRANTFRTLLSIPRRHQAPSVSSRVADTIEKFS